jgi:hypothetical protein
MPHRDPDTGQFLPHDSVEFDDIEVATFSATVGVEASDLDGSTGFGGGTADRFEAVEVVDYDDLVDRNEELRLLSAQHRIDSYINSTQTADGTVAVAVEVSAAPSLTGVTSRLADPNTGTEFAPDNAVGTARTDDTIDIVGRPLVATAHGPFSDGSSGAGGGGSAGDDDYQSDMFPAEFGAWHPRDELFVNGEFVVWNVSDAGVHVEIVGQHVYGVVE